ncbi:LacI family DNA-binding transcriptional regulator [Serratia fonticola]|jgi:DNA-binding LacI/PurR family transcriptional regulator|uniref:LacI family DNA-binding transcriptional regulator n=1 Tax=Serratia fonticola TaxID=47917 RepID=A0AAJ1YIY1_SERFO|nr:LacI family DNA-binding transcriptional regulator [Serratia fonticola]ATM74638.1 transcriptional regulator [Serratia fonticola]MDQ7209526.1 LacI family DNA-binding transcriptional regulator [Serratia fonticola]MDQ9130067.1 LacI family DNA-binding transcriptional regulator [Serratia fonticola]HBE9079451.1 LacI family DNA-binding transcriptional regulator [Serratia fonticola]HBE9088842.1 LacI family DNA-binding transcriptional regulator [Serratia fonticola]
MASLKDVAKLANVSLMTVSRALNSPERLKPETLARVQIAINETNYVPDLSAKKIRGAHATPNTIGVLALDTVTTPFSVEITLSIEETARAYGWNSFVVNMFSDDNPDTIVDLLLSHRPDGIIYTTMGLRQVPLPPKLLTLPCVLANCESLHDPVASYIPDDEQGQFEAVQALLAAGNRQPLCLHLPKHHLATLRRRQGLERACRQAGINPDTLMHVYMEHGDEHYRDIPAIVLAHIKQGNPMFDSVICGNDRIAFMVYQTLLAQGLRIPQDVAVVGYDNMVGIGELFLPPLSTVQLPHYEIGRHAALHIIQGKTQTDTVKIPAPLLNRDSIHIKL